MTKFENIGCQYQRESCSKEEADANFKNSCRCCNRRGMQIQCDRCAIAAAHDFTIALLDDLAAMKQRRVDVCAEKCEINVERVENLNAGA